MMINQLFSCANDQKSTARYTRTNDDTSSPAQTSGAGDNYQFSRAAQGVGGTLQTIKRITGSSEKILAQAFGEVKDHFDKGPAATGGFSDIPKHSTQMLFQATWHGKPVVGLATAEVNSQSGQTEIRFIFNQQNFLGATLKQLTPVDNEETGTNPVESLQWSWQESREKASRLKLPAGWQILDSNVQGMLYARGPQGSVTFGLYFNIYTPEYMFAAIDQRIAVAAYCDPVSAFKNVLCLAFAKYL